MDARAPVRMAMTCARMRARAVVARAVELCRGGCACASCASCARVVMRRITRHARLRARAVAELRWTARWMRHTQYPDRIDSFRRIAIRRRTTMPDMRMDAWRITSSDCSDKTVLRRMVDRIQFRRIRGYACRMRRRSCDIDIRRTGYNVCLG